MQSRQIVEEQGKEINQIETNVTSAEDATEKGVGFLTDAVKTLLLWRLAIAIITAAEAPLLPSHASGASHAEVPSSCSYQTSHSSSEHLFHPGRRRAPPGPSVSNASPPAASPSPS